MAPTRIKWRIQRHWYRRADTHTHTHRHTHTDTHTRTHTITCVPGLLLLVLAGMTGFFLHETEGNSGSFWCQPGTWSYRSDNGNIVTPCTTSVTLAHKSVVYISFTGHASVETGSCYGSASVGHQRTVCVCACVHAHNRKTHTSGHLSVSCPTYVSVCLSACVYKREGLVTHSAWPRRCAAAPRVESRGWRRFLAAWQANECLKF